METANDTDMMAAQAAPRVRKDHPAKKSSAQQNTKEGEGKNILYAVSEHSLCEFLEDEPDIYSVSDLKVRYR
jgi:hypothetical protein